MGHIGRLGIALAVAGAVLVAPPASVAKPEADASGTVQRGFKDDANEACASFQDRLNRLQERAEDVSADRQRAAVLEDTAELLDELMPETQRDYRPGQREEACPLQGTCIRAFKDVARHYRRAAGLFRDGDVDRADAKPSRALTLQIWAFASRHALACQPVARERKTDG